MLTHAQIDNFAKYSNGQLGVENDGHAEIEISKDNLLKPQGDLIEAIIKNTFPMFCVGACDTEYLND